MTVPRPDGAAEHGSRVPGDRRQVVFHLTGQATVEVTADQLWPLHGEYGRFGVDLESFAEEVLRRLRTDGYVGYRWADERLTVIPFSAVKRLDFR
ncbi:MAG TPA: hypothetical protein VMB79_12045 [Jatrophihabitans sp.]|nr:hypothetical protein [Jatrophihabitans sp.]